MSFFAGKTCLITGSTSGYGLSLAKLLAGQSARLILTHRRNTPDFPKELSEARLVGSTYLTQDLKLDDLASIRSCAKALEDEKIDFLFNNAGTMCLSYSSSVDKHEYNAAVNHLGPFLLTNLLLGRLRPGGQVINLTCGAFRSATGINFEQMKVGDKEEWNSIAYAESKLCSIVSTREMHQRLTAAG